MKLKSMLWTVGLLLLAALTGWLLPVLAFPDQSDAVEEAASPVEIRRVDLNYESDLSTADRISLIRDYQGNQFPLERGVFLRREDVFAIADAFLFDLTAQSFPVSDETCSAEPVLKSYEGIGTFAVWQIRVMLTNGWVLEAVVDDQSGVLLQFSLLSFRESWEELFPELSEAEDSVGYLCERFRSAFHSQLRRRLSEAWSVEAEELNGGALPEPILLRVREAGRVVCTVPLTLNLPAGRAFLNH